MKYTTEIIVNIPLDEFMTKFDNPENMKHWQKGLVSFSPLSGAQGQEGGKMELRYKMGKRELVLIETILRRNLPYEFHATYEAKGVHNIQKNYFKALDDNSSKWISETEFEFNGFMMKVMAFFMPGAFKKQSLQYMRDFKSFAETGASVAEVKAGKSN